MKDDMKKMHDDEMMKKEMMKKMEMMKDDFKFCTSG